MTFAYTIDKKTFIDSINSIIKLHSFMDKLYEDGIDITNTEAIIDIESHFVDLLCKCCNDKVVSEEDAEYFSDIGYFLYDLDAGKEWKEESFKIDGKTISLQSSEDLWNYIEKYNLKVEDK